MSRQPSTPWGGGLRTDGVGDRRVCARAGMATVVVESTASAMRAGRERLGRSC